MASDPTPYVLKFFEKNQHGFYTFNKDALEKDLKKKINENLCYNNRLTELVMGWIRERLLKKLIDFLKGLLKDGPPKLPTTPEGLFKAMLGVFLLVGKSAIFLSDGDRGENRYHPIYERDAYLECLLFNYVWCGKAPARYRSLARYFNDADRARIRSDLERQRENASLWERLVLPTPKH